MRFGLKFRGWLLLLLFAHVLLHPWVHAVDVSKPAGDITLESAATHSSSATTAGEQCELCRVGHNATIAPQAPKIELINPGWIQTALQAVNYSSLQADRHIPSRAPPIL